MERIPLPQDFKDLFKLLHAHGVAYLLVGGWAVGFHGYARNTADIDIWIEPKAANWSAVRKTLNEFLGVEVPADALDQRPFNLHFGVAPNRIDIMTDVSGVEFKECFKRRLSKTVDGLPVVLIALEDLLRNKRSTGRDKDLLDVKTLEKFHSIVKRKKTK